MQVHLAAAACSTPTSKPLLAMQQPSDTPVNGRQPLQGDSEGFRYLFCSTQQPPSHTEIMKRIMAADYKLPPSRPVTAECADLLSRILTQVRGVHLLELTVLDGLASASSLCPGRLGLGFLSVCRPLGQSRGVGSSVSGARTSVISTLLGTPQPVYQ